MSTLMVVYIGISWLLGNVFMNKFHAIIRRTFYNDFRKLFM